MLTTSEKLRKNYLQLVSFNRTELDMSVIPNSTSCVAWQVDPTLCRSFEYTNVIPEAVASHVISRHFLKLIADESGHVASVTLDAVGGLKKDEPYNIIHTHINTMSTFHGFCNSEDTGKSSCEHFFNDLDVKPLDHKNIFKYIYRDFGKRIVMLKSEIEHTIKNKNKFISVLKDYGSKEPELDLDELLSRYKYMLYTYKTAFSNLANMPNIKSEYMPNIRFYDIETLILSEHVECYGMGIHTNEILYKDIGLIYVFSFILFHSDADNKQCVTIIQPKFLRDEQRVFNHLLKQQSKTNKSYAFVKLLELAMLDMYNTIAFKIGFTPIENIVQKLNCKLNLHIR